MTAYRPFRHLGLKILAVGLATVLWFAIAGEPLVERGLTVPLEFLNVPAGLGIVGDTPRTIGVRVRGSSAVVSRLEPSDVVAVLDLGDAGPGRHLFHLSPAEVRTPFGVEVAQVVPSTIPLAFERSGRRFVPVAPEVEGDPAPGYMLGRVSSQPASVEVIGPASVLSKLTAVITEPVSVTNAAAPVHAEVTVGVTEASLRVVGVQRVRVRVDIVSAPVERVFRDVPVRLKNVDPALTVNLEPSSVTIEAHGPWEAIRGVPPDSLQVFVDLTGLGAGRHMVEVHVADPGILTIDNVDPTSIEIQLR